jgi:AraC-like DNA-binding protein
VALLLDTGSLDRADRAEAVVAAMQEARIRAELTHEPGLDAVHARLELWELGGGVTLLHRTSSGIRLRRTPRMARSWADDRMSLTVLGPGRWRFVQRDVDRVVRSDDWETIVVDQSAPYEFERVGDGSTYAFTVGHDTLGLSVDTVRAAAGRLQTSPLWPMVSRHVLDVVRSIEGVPSGPATTMIGTATTELFRALVVTAVRGGGDAGELSPESLLSRTKAYVQLHAGDHDLTPERIARAHNVSVRKLYTAWSGNEESLASHVIAQRLELARRMLSATGSRSRTIAAVARDCGFVDTPHFSRRFRNAYGLSPREWRQLRGSAG